ncbi:MAG: hypothetical protein AB7G88_05190, partial [Thermomicrobiales bacterium]
MAMRMPRFLKPISLPNPHHAPDSLALLTKGEPAEIIPFPAPSESESPSLRSTVTARAELRSRRLRESRRPAEDRFEATLLGTTGS